MDERDVMDESFYETTKQIFDSERLSALHELMIAEEKEILNTKGQDYTQRDKDRLANFKNVARDLGVEPEVAWAVYFMKHIHAIMTWVKTGKVESEGLEGRFADIRNYALLGRAIYEEKTREDLDEIYNKLKKLQKS